MKLRRIAVVVTCLVAALLFLASNVTLALTSSGYCMTLWRIPFMNRSVEVPDWFWLASIAIWPVSIVSLLVVWFRVVLSSRKPRASN